MAESAEGSVVDVGRVLESSDRLSNNNRLRQTGWCVVLMLSLSLANEVMIYFA